MYRVANLFPGLQRIRPTTRVTGPSLDDWDESRTKNTGNESKKKRPFGE